LFMLAAIDSAQRWISRHQILGQKSMSSPGKFKSVSFSCLVVCLMFVMPAISGIAGNTATSYTSGGSLVYYADVCQFEGNDGKTLVEISYSLPLRQLSGVQQGSREQNATFSIAIRFTGSHTDTVINFSENRNVELPSDQRSDAPDLFVDLNRFELRPDTMDMVITIQDLTSGKEGLVSQPLVVRNFPNSFSLSDLFFISHIQKADQKSVFDKNGILMLPNPSRTFSLSDEQQKAYVYYEINHLKFPVDQASFYSLRFTVRNMNGKNVFTQWQDAIRKSASRLARIDAIPLKDLSNGIYECIVNITDLETEQNQEVSGYFRVNSAADSQALVLPMSEADIQKYYNQIKYISTHRQLQTFKELDPAGKQRFLLDFWKSKDPDPTTSRNEFMEEHFRRIAYCENNFKGGINSDMARIYIQHGPPVEITREASPVATIKDNQIWTYSYNGSTQFVFVDRTGDGRYLLVHSTDPDEIQNSNWEDEVRRSIPQSNKPYQNQF